MPNPRDTELLNWLGQYVPETIETAQDDDEITLKFFAMRHEVTENITFPESMEGKFKVFEAVMICEGEATHCCSLSASSHYTFLYNVMESVDDSPYDDWSPEAQQFDDDISHDSGGEWHGYMTYIAHDSKSPAHSELIEFEGESREECEQDAHEYFDGNHMI